MIDVPKERAVLSPSVVLRHGIGDAVRPVFFQTEYEEFLYATDGGTLFLVRFKGSIYGITAGHVFTGNGFGPNRLFVPREKFAKRGTPPAPIRGICYPSSPRSAAEGSDIVDLCLIQFDDNMPRDFFKGTPYNMDTGPIGSSKAGHSLIVHGVLKEKTTIIHAEGTAGDIVIGYCRLEYTDATLMTHDPTLREAKTEFGAPEFGSVTGISGSPVYDTTAGALCGMVVRGGMDGTKSSIRFIDISDIHRFLEAVAKGAHSVDYKKIVPEYR